MIIAPEVDIAVAWHGLPKYAARLLRSVCQQHSGRFHIIGTPGPFERGEIETELGMPVRWIDGGQATSWRAVCLPPPHIFIHTGWAYRAFNCLAADTRAHGGAVVSMIDNSDKRTLRQFIGHAYFRAVLRRRFDLAWVPGASARLLLEGYGFPSDRIYEGLYGADTSIFLAGPTLSARAKQFLFVGQLIGRKAPVVLVEAFEQFREKMSEMSEWTMCMVGDGPLRKRLLGRGSIRLLPFSDPAEIALLMAGSRFLVLPSLEEHWGLVVHEAVCSGCGIIISDRVGARYELATPRNSFIVPPNDRRALANAMIAAALMDDKQLASAYKDSLFVARQFGPRRFSQVFTDIVVRATAMNPRRGLSGPDPR
jgi:glycosyltransferase involved in cell wall biosynthesis